MTAHLLTLAARVQAEEPSPLLWSEAMGAIMGASKSGADISLRAQILAWMINGAYRDAAAVLMPEGWNIEELFEIERGKTVVCRLYRDHLHELSESEATGPHAEARARLAAALRARAAEVGNG